ncbi:sulfurtransferase TusA family protein, partial [Streptomyces pathocidini]
VSAAGAGDAGAFAGEAGALAGEAEAEEAAAFGGEAGPSSASAGAVGGEEPALTVDSLGKRCPVPVIELAKVIGDVAVGEVVAVLSDDEAARLDFPAWCEMRGQEYVGERPAERGSAYLVRRRA